MMRDDERAVPATLARAELTATVCTEPRPSLGQGFRGGNKKNLYFSKRSMAKNVMLYMPVRG